MKITTIGYWGAYPAANEATSGYLLQSEGENILIDCGSGVLSNMQNYIELVALDAVILSHYHADHMADIYTLQYAMRILMDLKKRKKPLHIYGHAEDKEFEKLHYYDYTIANAIDERKPLKLGELTIFFNRNVHSDTCFSMRIEKKNKKIVYTADTGWDDTLIKFADKADLLICESSLYNENVGTITGHLSAGEAGKIAAMADVKQLVLSHLPHFGEHDDLLKQARENFDGKIEMAKTGMNWRL
ncbi:MBL fold metallo-hydrolase [Marinisporobacter balticus]|uniref:Ribonuclease BN (tRNA processing enzyme) n=1 Tax=Marinisporobacter balticus TaxID=2018667 RepID=A0A4V6NP73_9FIRM|nr:MBL fold metallo-hydrolase [Marinisporobacter balticus]TCO68820.1 ribonuclease BN (tRNA processing enzyme) [Marinisporobacter balticus]